MRAAARRRAADASCSELSVELRPELLRATELRDVERSRKPQRVELRCELRRVTELRRGLRRTIELWQQLLRAIELRAVEWLRGLLHRLCGCASGGGTTSLPTAINDGPRHDFMGRL